MAGGFRRGDVLRTNKGTGSGGERSSLGLGEKRTQRKRQRGREAERQKGRKAERQKGRKAERQKGRKAERQKGRKAERQKNFISRVRASSFRANHLEGSFHLRCGQGGCAGGARRTPATPPCIPPPPPCQARAYLAQRLIGGRERRNALKRSPALKAPSMNTP